LAVHRRPHHGKQIEVATLDKKWLDELAVVELDRETNSACTQIKLTSDPRVTDTHPILANLISAFHQGGPDGRCGEIPGLSPRGHEVQHGLATRGSD
jgi:hypothetical protein